MKHFYVAAATVAASLMIFSCGGTKSITQATGEKEVTIPCSDKHSDKEFFRGMGIGQSKDLNTARDKARMAANAELAGSITTLIKQVSERYVNDAGQKPEDYAETFEGLTKQVVNQQISNLSVACNKTTSTGNGMYKVYMSVEASKDEVFKALERNAESQKKLETIFNREKFRKNFDEEMAKFEKENSVQ
ncbi:MAG: hypothetical protein LBK18_00410 [Prevotellaceae bacterium]|jgi:uncharacterized protein (UPF0333 family)|nr:hypothetical protein [Prevotellaceae bacterium]